MHAAGLVYITTVIGLCISQIRLQMLPYVFVLTPFPLSRRMGRRIREVFGDKVAFGLEGGYNLQASAVSTLAWGGWRRERYTRIPPEANGAPVLRGRRFVLAKRPQRREPRPEGTYHFIPPPPPPLPPPRIRPDGSHDLGPRANPGFWLIPRGER